MKKIFFYGMVIFILLLMVSGVFGYKRVCLKKGEYVPLPPNDPRYICDHDKCIICVTDNYYPTHPGRCNHIGKCEELGDPQDPIVLAMVVNKPDNQVYEDNKIIFDVDLSKPATLYYTLDGEEKRACSRCSSYKKEKRFNDGEFEITFRAVYGEEEVSEIINFEVDEDEPEIDDVSPERGFANGVFTVEYEELNLKKVKLFYGSLEEFNTNNFNIAVREDCPSGKKESCTIEVNLDVYTKIYYFFELEDNFQKTRSEIIELDVDFDKPVITVNTEFESLYSERKVLFDLSINDEVDLYYIDLLTEKEKRLCSNCDSYKKEKRFKDGYHDIKVIARDEANNEDIFYTSFSIDSKEPKIRNVEPRRGFANGEFTVEYDEYNLESVKLVYNGIEKEISCESGKRKECKANVNLKDFTEVSYYFIVSDSYYSVSSKTYTLDVDVEAPVFTKFEYIIDGRYVYFDIEISEEVDLEYRDNGRWRTLKRGKDSYEGRKSFRGGTHEVIVRGIDEAGNIVTETFSFVV